jgi:hypothetical protein
MAGAHSILATASWRAVSQTALWDVAIRMVCGIQETLLLTKRNKAPCDGALQDAAAPASIL